MNLSKTFPIFLLILLTSGYATAQNNAEQQVRKLERAWLDAYEQRDVKAMSATSSAAVLRAANLLGFLAIRDSRLP